MKVPPPTLEGERVRLRPVKEEDLRGIVRYAADPEVCRFTLWGPHDRKQSEKHLQQLMERYRRGEASIVDWTIERRDDGQFLGKCSLHHSLGEEAVHLGIVLDRGFLGKGYAREALDLLMDAAFSQYGFERVIGTCAPENQRSKRLMERLEMRFVKRDPHYEVRKDEWAERLVYEMIQEEFYEA